MTVFYCAIESDAKTIATIKESIDKYFPYAVEVDFGNTAITWMSGSTCLDEFENVIKAFPASVFDITTREEEMGCEGCSIYAPGDGSAVSCEWVYDDIVDEDVYWDEHDDDDDADYDGYLEEYFNAIHDDPENQAKTSSRAKRFV